MCAQVEPQLIPAGFELTVPEPVPDSVTVKVSGNSVNVAVTALAWVMLTVQVPVPEQAPDQPVKLDPVPAVAVSVTEVPPLPKDREQTAPQLIPPMLEDTEPEPVPVFATLRMNPQTSIAAFCVPHWKGWATSGGSTVSMPVPQTRHALLGSGLAPA